MYLKYEHKQENFDQNFLRCVRSFIRLCDNEWAMREKIKLNPKILEP